MKKHYDINCFESTEQGKVLIHVEDIQGECVEIVVEAADIERMMIAGINALKKKAGRL